LTHLSQVALERALTTAWLGRPAHVFGSVGSTNDVARDLAGLGAPEGTLVITDVQTAGRGRLDRSWIAPPGSSLLFSLLFRPATRPELAMGLTMVAGLACAEAVEARTGLRPGLKWPNDLMLQDRKLAGILTEAETVGDRISSVVVGVGLNVNVDFRQADASAELRDVAIGLSQALGQRVDRLSLLNAILT